MKKNKIFFTIILIVFSISLTFAQTYPETFNYQAVARNDDGTAIVNEQIVVEVTVLQGTDCDDNEGACNIVWQELHYPVTSEFGLFSIDIGDGQNTFAGSSVDFPSINWNDFTSGNYFLKLRVDFGNSGFGNGLIDVGIVKFQSVPYSFSAESAVDIERQGGKVPINITELLDVNISTIAVDEVLSWNGTNWVNANVSAGGPISLDDLTDVAIASPATNNVLYYNGTNWLNDNLAFSQLDEVTLSSPSASQFLSFNGTDWVNSSLSTASISDFNIAAQTIGQALIWDGTDWVNQDVTATSAWTEDVNYVYYNGTKNVGIGTATPSQAFQVNLLDNDGIYFNGTFNTSGTVPDLGAGTRMTFFPSKSAFRVGNVDGTQWNNAVTGNYSFAAGRNNTASGVYATAFGYNNQASGVASLSIGTTNVAVGLNAFVCGTNNNASAGIDGDNSIVAGTGNDGYSQNSLTVGTSNDNNGENSIVFGETCKTDGTGYGSLAGGISTYASGYYSVAFGQGTTAQAFASLVLGRYNTTSGSQINWVGADPIFVVGNGTGVAARNNALVIYKNGNISTEGTLTEGATNPSKAQSVTDYKNILLLNALYEIKNDKIYYGFDASEVEEYFPSLVVNFNSGKAISYTQFVPLMVETIKDQQNTIEQLKKENEELKSRLDLIETKIETLENK